MDTINPVLERITRDLPCELTHADLVRAVKDLGAVLEATAHEEARQKAAKKEMASKLAELEMQRQELGAKITTGRELRPVSVEVVADYEKGTAQEIGRTRTRSSSPGRCPGTRSSSVCRSWTPLRSWRRRRAPGPCWNPARCVGMGEGIIRSPGRACPRSPAFRVDAPRSSPSARPRTSRSFPSRRRT